MTLYCYIQKKVKKYPIDYTIEELIAQLPPPHFFRINRQCIIHSQYLDEMRMEGNQMHLTLKIGSPLPLMVSQRNVALFKRWLNEED